MVVANGYIRVVSQGEGSSFDSKGNPIKATESLGAKIPCNYQRNNYQGRGTYEGGEYTQASYTILIDGQRFEPCVFRLYTSWDEYLGEYQAQQKGIVDLIAVGNIQITV